jgi:hypothetical protein
MTTITIDAELINEVIAVSPSQNAQEAVIKILADDELALLFTRHS